MRILLTSSRAPATVDLLRAFAQQGHEVYATDTFPWTPGAFSRYLTRHLVTPPPRQQPQRFARMLAEIVTSYRIDWLIPTCEEVFYVARHHAALAQHTNVYCEPLATLTQWHDKYQFQQLATRLGMETPRTVLLRTTDELAAHLSSFPRYLLKPVFSRFASRIVTNCGPRRNVHSLATCQPTAQQPWLLQSFVDGETVCSYSTLHAGHVTSHCAYRTPQRAGHGSGVRFVSLDGEQTLALVETLGAATGYTGQMALDYICTADGRLVLLECNPRATSGVHLLDPAHLVGGMLDPQHPTVVAPAGRSSQLAAALMLYTPAALLQPTVRRTPDVLLRRDDPLPALGQLPLTLHFLCTSRRQRISLTEATTYDIEWNK